MASEKSGSAKNEGLQIPGPEQIAQQDVMDSCMLRSVIAGVGGLAMGAAFGIFASAMEGASGSMVPEAAIETRRARDVFFETVRTTRAKSWSYGKGFGIIGILFSGSECAVEKYRAKHDLYNTLYAGCFTGGALAHSGGPKMMCIGCASFAAFSIAIERFLEH